MNDYKIFKRIFLTGLFPVVCWVWIALSILSPFGINVFTIGDTFLIEIPLLILVFMASLAGVDFSTIANILSKSRVWISVVLGAGVLAFIGYYSHGSLKASLGDFRSIVLIATAVALLFSPRVNHLALVPAVAFMALFASALTLIYVRMGFGSDVDVKSALPVITAAVSVVYFAYMRAYVFYLLSLALMCYMAASSFYRSLLLMGCLISVYSTYALIIIGPKTRGSKFNLAPMVMAAGMLLALFASLRFGLWDKLYAEWASNSDARGHIISKTENLLASIRGEETLGQSDTQRLDYYLHAVNNPGYYIMPRGLGSRESIDALSSVFPSTIAPASTRDSLFYFFLYHGGWITFVIVVLMLTSLLLYKWSQLPLFLKFNRLAIFVISCVYLSLTSEMLLVVMKGISNVLLLYVAVIVPEREWSLRMGNQAVVNYNVNRRRIPVSAGVGRRM